MDDHLRRPEIVPMQPRHIEEIAAIEKLCFSRPWSYEALADELRNPLAVFFVAERDEKAAAYAGMHHILDEGYITNIAVHPDYRRQGLATALVRALDRYADENDLNRLTLEVRASNSAAIDIYRRAGFDQEGVRTGFYDDPIEDGLILSKYY